MSNVDIDKYSLDDIEDMDLIYEDQKGQIS